jgi:signal transduction histidine kinase
MSTVHKHHKPKARRTAAAGASRSSNTVGTRPRRKNPPPILSAEAEETLNAIRAGQVDALVIHGDDSDKLYAVRSFVEIQRTQIALENAGAERERSDAQLKAFAEERERLFQDMHDGCIQSIYAAALNLEACLRLIEVDPKKTTQMIAEATVTLNLVIQELRSFITGQKLQIASGRTLRTEIEQAVSTAATQGLDFAVEVDDDAMMALTAEQAAHVLQIVRECISNAMRHANARSGRISLRYRKGIPSLEVSDDGRGFDSGKMNKFGLGLHHIKARARKLGGTARVTSALNKGTRIIVQLGKA